MKKTIKQKNQKVKTITLPDGEVIKIGPNAIPHTPGTGTIFEALDAFKKAAKKGLFVNDALTLHDE